MSENLWGMAIAEFGSITGYFNGGKSGQTRILAIKRGPIDRGITVLKTLAKYSFVQKAAM